ncbi:MAG: DUF4349 domain-containing protein [Patescibacteria group bacterium]
MKGIVTWIKNHKLLILLIIIILYLLTSKNSTSLSRTSSVPRLSQNSEMLFSAKSPVAGGINNGVINQPAAVTDVKNRLVIQDSYLSLQVLKVNEVQKAIIKKAEELGGYMVSSLVTDPSDVASAAVIVRIPAKKLESALEYYRSLSLKVVSENLQGQDVTDQYVDLDTQLKTYEKTKAKLEDLFNNATIVQDILQIQMEIINVQASIDSIKGQQDYLVKNAAMAKITVYLSTDELALPYAPSGSWRPGVIFKQAARAVAVVILGIGTLIIWIAVFSVIWVPVLLITLYIRRRNKIV